MGSKKSWLHFRPPPVDFCGSQAVLCGRKLPLRSCRVAPPEILGQIDDVAALARAEDLQHCVELAAQLGDLLIALCQQCSDAVGDAVDEFLFGKWGPQLFSVAALLQSSIPESPLLQAASRRQKFFGRGRTRPRRRLIRGGAPDVEA